MKTFKYIWIGCLILLLASCRGDDLIYYAESEQVTETTYSDIQGFYLLNEANMGSNKASLDYFDYQTGIYTRNIYAEANPHAVLELGDVGNDLKIYGSKLYAIINCSHKVEVMQKGNAQRIAQIDIPNCRHIAFDGPYAYVTSFIGPVEINPHAPLGAVYKIDTLSLAVVDSVTVGYQPEEMAVSLGKLYVANSGGYLAPNYDNSVSVIDLETFAEVRKVQVAINLHRVRTDNHGYVYVTSKGDYSGQNAQFAIINSQTDQVVKQFSMTVSDLCIVGDSAYYYGSDFSYTTGKSTVTYGIFDLFRQEVVSTHLITDGTDELIKMPYGIWVNPITKEFYVTDAKNYVIPGTLYCFSPDGVKKWSVTTGMIPAHIACLGDVKE